MRLRGPAILIAALVLAPAAGAETVVIVKGRGWGHGIGMSQWGARGLAERGHSHERILAHYYPGTRLGPAPVERVRVLLAEGRKELRLGSARAFVAVDARGRRVVVSKGGIRVGPKLVVRGVRMQGPVRFLPGARPLRLGGAPYRGELVVRSRAGLMSAVNELRLELYLRGVVPYEMPNHWAREALRAQAVVARSYALATLKPGKIFDLHSDTRSQVYGGLRAETQRTNEAIGSTAGRVVLWGGRVATTFYHSTSGGKTVPAWEVWPKADRVPYLRGVPDPSDYGPLHTWGPLVFRGEPLLRDARRIEPVRGPSGRVSAVLVDGRRIDGSAFRRELGLRSTWFSLSLMRLERGRPLELRGMVRGIERPVIQRQLAAGWRQVARVRPEPDGSFRLAVRAPGRYRLAGERTPGPTVRAG